MRKGWRRTLKGLLCSILLFHEDVGNLSLIKVINSFSNLVAHLGDFAAYLEDFVAHLRDVVACLGYGGLFGDVVAHLRDVVAHLPDVVTCLLIW